MFDGETEPCFSFVFYIEKFDVLKSAKILHSAKKIVILLVIFSTGYYPNIE